MFRGRRSALRRVLSSGSFVWRPEDVARTGAIVSIGHDGTVEIERGRIRPEDRQDKPSASGAAKERDESHPTRDASALPERLIEDLTAHRTAALRVMPADEPCVALLAVTHALALAVFYGDSSFGNGSCLDLRVHSPDLRGSADGIADSSAAVLLDERHAAWSRRLPPDAEQLWVWLLHQTPDIVTEFLAFCAAFTPTAVRKPKEPMDAPRLRHADRLAATLDLDMTGLWRPTVSSYFGRVAKSRILEAVTEAVSKGAADNLINLKKDALAVRAEEKVAGTGWLPSVLRPERWSAWTLQRFASDKWIPCRLARRRRRISCCCRQCRRLREVGLVRRSRTKTGVRPLGVEEIQILADQPTSLGHRVIGPQIDLLVVD